MPTKSTPSGPPKRRGRPPGTKNPPGAKVGRPRKNLNTQAATVSKAAKDSEPAAKKPKTSHPTTSGQAQLARAGKAEQEVRGIRGAGSDEPAVEFRRTAFRVDLTNEDSDQDDTGNAPGPPSTCPTSPLSTRTSLAPSPPSSAQPTPAIEPVQLPGSRAQPSGIPLEISHEEHEDTVRPPALLPEDTVPANIRTDIFVQYDAGTAEHEPPSSAAGLDATVNLATLVLNNDDTYSANETGEESLDDVLDDAGPGATPEEDVCMDDIDDEEYIEGHQHREGSQTTGIENRTTWQSQPRSSIPTWLASRYDSLCDTLSQQCRSNSSRMPTCYASGTFELAPPAPIFSTRHHAQLSPSLFYGVRFFIWLPHLFGRIPCPQCKKAGRFRDNGSPVLLQCLGWPQAPRRAVDIEENVFIVGYRYRCTHDSCKKTFLSWSHSILEVLPPLLSSHFTFHCTRRCALTDRLVALLRHMFQHGIGPSPFTNIIRTFHVRRYEQLALQYLEAVKLRLNSPVLSIGVRPERFSAWDDRNGFAGYVPSATFFTGFYNQYIEGHAPEIDKQMSMLSARFLAIDHSHKLVKHLSKVNGESVCGALHSTVNEYGEMCAAVLTPTKAHDQFMPVLAAIPHSLRAYGHDDVQLVFTDNPRADKPELERAIPSLTYNVHPILPPNSLVSLEVPTDWAVYDLNTDFRIRNSLNSILEDLQKLPAETCLDVAVDMEWPVDLAQGIHGKVAILSIAYEQSILLVHTSIYENGGHLNLPPPLLTFLRSSRIRKLGVHVKGDLTRLFNDCGFSAATDQAFVGATEIGALAKLRGLCSRASISLVDLTALILKRHLPKDESIRVSTGWDNKELSVAHRTYAALDVYAVWSLYQTLSNMTAMAQPVTKDSSPGTPVRLLSRDGSSIVALGVVAPDRPKQFAGVNVTQTRVIVNITSILQSGYLIRNDLIKSSKETSLAQFATTTPFGLLCYLKDLQRCDVIPDPLTPLQSSPLPPTSYQTSPPQDNEVTISELSSDGSRNTIDDEASLAEEQHLSDSEADPFSALRADTLLAEISSLTYKESAIHSRVLGDLWHVTDQVKVSQKHGIHAPYKRALRDALLIVDPEDKAAVEVVLERRGVKFSDMVLWKSDWVWKRVKRLVPCATILFQRVSEVFKTYGPLKDAKTGKPLFKGEDQWQQARNILENIRMGLYSDPPDISLYTVRGQDKDGLTVYRCMRGTNSVEGGIHQNIIRYFGAFNASPRLSVNLIRDYCLMHNLRVGTLNRTGKPYRGSFDIWTRNRLAQLADVTRVAFAPETVEKSVIGWVNGRDYASSNEVFGILPLPPSTRQKLGLLPYNEALAKGENIKHANLAKQQNSTYAILPVHTSHERHLYRLIRRQYDGLFTQRSQPDWVALAMLWSTHCDGVKVFYKLPEHLKSYHKRWLEIRNEEDSIESSREAYEAIRKALEADSRRIPAIPVAERTTISEEISPLSRITHHDEHDLEVSEWQVANALGQHSRMQESRLFKYMPDNPSAQPTVTAYSSSNDKGKKRAAGCLDEGAASASSLKLLNSTVVDPATGRTVAIPVKRRAPRKCKHCHRGDCVGAFRSRPCQYSTASTSADSSSGTAAAGPGPSSMAMSMFRFKM
ncbi:hypothetical protein BC835DRAFT_1317043 [Cytidiella melzeri]|nr:hypothetical protein BC835DRAFT_1317043 [Cytidiella melzeri]